MIPNVKRGVSTVRARDSTLPIRWPCPGGTTIAQSDMRAMVPDAALRGGVARPRRRQEAFEPADVGLPPTTAEVEPGRVRMRRQPGGHDANLVHLVDRDVRARAQRRREP